MLSHRVAEQRYLVSALVDTLLKRTAPPFKLESA